MLRPHITNTIPVMNEAIAAGKSILFEGAQGAYLDVDFGTYPFVTSSNTSSAGACTGTGVPPHKIDRIIGVCKAYTTRVGAGPFVTEDEDISNHLHSMAANSAPRPDAPAAAAGRTAFCSTSPPCSTALTKWP